MTTNYSEIFSRPSKVLLVHFALFLFFSFALHLALFHHLMEWQQFIQWDTSWYISIKDNGYQYVENAQNNTGFFPLYPWLWKVSTLGTAGICVLNGLLFIASFYLLVYFFKPTEKTQYLFLSIPSFFFFVVPYSESLFLLFSTLLLIGLKKENWLLTTIAFILAALTRSAGTIFIPALVLSVFFLSNRSNVKKIFLEYSLYIMACIAMTVFVIWLQYEQTGVWFAAAKTHQYWDHSLRIPQLPLRSWGKNEIARLDGSAMVIGLIALSILLFSFLSKIKKNHTETNKYYLFSLLYLVGIMLSLLAFQGGDIHSMSRYLLATAFYFIFLLEFEKWKFTWRQVLWAFLLLNVFWLLFGSYRHITSILNYLVLSAFLSLFLLVSNPVEKIARWSFIFIYLLSTFLQAYFFVSFLNSGWVG